jgi:hypothetical protein
MDSSRLAVKFYADDSSGVSADEVVPIFHSWIQERALSDHMLIDVADYSHVPDGPGAVLVAREANIYLDRFDKRVGLRYSRKQALEGSSSDRLRFLFRAALQACELLEQNTTLGGRIRFRTDQASFQINDRLLAPNTAQTFDSVKPELNRFLTELYGAVRLEYRDDDPKNLFEVFISSTVNPDITTLLSRLNSHRAAAV